MIGVLGGGAPGGLPDYLGAVDPGSLPLGGPLVIEDPAFAHKQLAQLGQGVRVEAFKIPVHLIVAKAHTEDVHLLFGQFRSGKAVDLCQFLLCDVHLHPSARLFSISSFLACWR